MSAHPFLFILLIICSVATLATTAGPQASRDCSTGMISAGTCISDPLPPILCEQGASSRLPPRDAGHDAPIPLTLEMMEMLATLAPLAPIGAKPVSFANAVPLMVPSAHQHHQRKNASGMHTLLRPTTDTPDASTGQPSESGPTVAVIPGGETTSLNARRQHQRRNKQQKGQPRRPPQHQQSHDDTRRLNISTCTNENDATTKFKNDATALGVSPFSFSDSAGGAGGTNAVDGINMTVNDQAAIALVKIENETTDCTECGAMSCRKISVDSCGDARLHVRRTKDEADNFVVRVFATGSGAKFKIKKKSSLFNFNFVKAIISLVSIGIDIMMLCVWWFTYMYSYNQFLSSLLLSRFFPKITLMLQNLFVRNSTVGDGGRKKKKKYETNVGGKNEQRFYMYYCILQQITFHIITHAAIITSTAIYNDTKASPVNAAIVGFILILVPALVLVHEHVFNVLHVRSHAKHVLYLLKKMTWHNAVAVKRNPKSQEGTSSQENGAVNRWNVNNGSVRSTKNYWNYYFIGFLLLATPHFANASFAPADKTALKTAVDACLRETGDGSCPIFAASNDNTGNSYGVIGTWNVSSVMDMSSSTYHLSFHRFSFFLEWRIWFTIKRSSDSKVAVPAV